jgi:hypothetical protein
MNMPFSRFAPMAVVSSVIMGVMMGCSSSTSNVVNPTPGSAVALREIGSLEVSGLVKREGENVLRWVPENPEPTWKNPYKGNVPELNLMWTE